MFKNQHRKLFSDIVNILGDGKLRITESKSPHKIKLPAVAYGLATQCHLDEFTCFTVGRKGGALGFEQHHGYFDTEVGKWLLKGPRPENRKERLKGICKKLGADHQRVRHLRYKLLCLSYAVLHEADSSQLRRRRTGCAGVSKGSPSLRRLHGFLGRVSTKQGSRNGHSPGPKIAVTGMGGSQLSFCRSRRPLRSFGDAL